MKSAIACDDWKVSVFERRLREALFVYDGPFVGLTPDIRIFNVTTDDQATLMLVLRQCQAECARRKAELQGP